MATKKTSAKKTGTQASSAGKAQSKPATKKSPAKKRIGTMSALDAAAKVLAETAQPMRAAELIETMSRKGFWSSPKGKTPAATLYAAMTREINTKGKDARFRKTERGLFALNQGK